MFWFSGHFALVGCFNLFSLRGHLWKLRGLPSIRGPWRYLSTAGGDTWAEAWACGLGLDVLGAGAGAYAGGTGATGWGMDVTSGWSWVVEDGGVTGWANTDSDSWDVAVFFGNDTRTTMGMSIIVEVNGVHKLQHWRLLMFCTLTNWRWHITQLLRCSPYCFLQNWWIQTVSGGIPETAWDSDILPTKARKQLPNAATSFSESVRTPVVLASNGKHPPTSCQKAWKRRVLPVVHAAVHGRVHSWLRSTEVWLTGAEWRSIGEMPLLDLHNFTVDCFKLQALQPGMPVKFYFRT